MSVRVAAEASLYIGGQQREAGGRPYSVVNPATESVIVEVPSATPEDVSEGLAVARAAQPEWGRAPGGIRGGLVRGIAEVIRSNSDQLARALTAEVGKPLAAAHGELEVVSRAVGEARPLRRTASSAWEVGAVSTWPSSCH